jgi:hypothetical protein
MDWIEVVHEGDREVLTAARRRSGPVVSQATPETDGCDRCGGLRAAGRSSVSVTAR